MSTDAAGADAAGGGAESAGTRGAEPPGQAGPARPGRAARPGSADDATRPLPPWSVERTVPAHEDLPRDAERGDVPSAATPPDGVPTISPAWAAGREPVSRAVQQALAARAVQRARMYRGSEGADPATGDQQELPLTVVPSHATAPVADVRDRLLGVLLADPARAVDAARRLDDSRDRIDQLGDALRRRREDLAGAVRHLHECGLDPVQIGRLSGIPTADVRTILDGEDADRG
ncbi:hypothetical protein H7X46_23850 [Pseudonocardia sp. C8]|uniref:hypothetical protein n=1 Tax=Pseudonocardia sp. C8 TaxID=2762759 RepID=UPI0016434F21|nr:hypothetical protein [Pseudonocardia sp. C8]MBC3194093.1 hypothetical protein [Pseudonocardia sp. C8]